MKYKYTMKMSQNFNWFYSRDNLPNKIKDEACVINLDEYSDIGTHWIALYVKINDITYFDSFDIEHIPKEIINLLIIKTLKQTFWEYKHTNSIMCGYYCIGFTDLIF